MSSTPFPNSISVDVSTKLGPLLIDVRDYGAVADSVEGAPGTDNTTAIQKALNDLSANIGGGTLYIPPSLKSFGCLDLDVPSHVYIKGRGIQSSLVRIGNLSSATRGLLNFAGSFSGVRDLSLLGGVTTSAGLLYSAFSSAAMNALLTQNSMIWVHSGATDITFEGGWIQHTGGYAGIMDASSANVSRIRWLNWVFRNNRPHAFGTSSGDLTYGSWTGGLLYYGDCNSALFAVDSLSVRGCKFYRSTGNCVWGDSLGFNIHHTNIDISGNYFEDFGLDAIELGNTRGFKVSGNRGRRGGYMTTTDVDTPNPKYLLGFSATFIDNSGYVEDGFFSDNGILSVNGEGMDLDGCRNVSIDGFNATIPLSGSPEYTSDSIALYGPSQNGIPTGRGIMTGDTSENGGAVGISISNVHLRGFGFSSILLAYAKNCTVSDFYIDHEIVSGGEVPVQIFSSSSGSPTGEWLCSGNIIQDGHINYNGANYCIAETGTGWTSAAINRIFNNECTGSSLGEFLPANSGGAQISGSVQGFSIAGASATAASVHVNLSAGPGQSGPLQTLNAGALGLSSTAVINWANNALYSAGAVDLELSRPSASLLAVTNGSSAYADIILRYLNAQGLTFNSIETLGGIYAAGLVVGITSDGPYFSKSTATPPTETTTTYGGLLHKSGSIWSYYNPATTSWSTIDLSIAGGGIVGADQQIIYNKGGAAYFADANLIWEYGSQILQVTAASSSVYGIYSKTGYILSDGGFNTGSSSSAAINALSGGVTALSLISIRNDGVSGVTIARTSSTARDYGFAVSSGGSFLLNDDTASAVRLSMTTAGVISIGAVGSAVNIDQSGNISYTGGITGSGSGSSLSVQGTAFNAIAATGGIYAAGVVVGITSDGPYFSKSTASPPTESTTTYGALLHKSGTQWSYYNPSTTSWATIDFATAGGAPGGSNTQVQYNNSGAFGGSANFVWNNAGQALTVTAASSSVAGIICGTGFIQSTVGFYSPGTLYNTVNIPSGGVLGATMTVGALISGRTEPFQMSLSYATMAMQSTSSSQYTGLNMLDNSGNLAGSFQYGNPSAPSYANVFFFAARNSTAIMSFYTNGSNSGLGNEQLRIKANGEIAIISGQITLTPIASAINAVDGAIYYNSSSNLFQFYQNGSFVGLGSVTSLTAGTGISVSASTGAVTITNIGVTSLGGSTGALSLGAGTGVSISGLTISIGQAVATSSNVTFNQMTLNGAETIVGSGSSILFQTYNGSTTPIQMNGNGVISCLQLNIGGATTIDTSGAFVNSAGVAVTSGGIGGAAFGAWVSGTSYSFGIGTGASPTTVTIASTASLTVGAGLILAVTAVSDGRLKNIVAPVTYGMDQIRSITPVHYTWNDLADRRMKQQNEYLSADKEEHIGFIAQEFAAALPKASFISEDGYYGIDRDGLLAAVVVALKQLDSRLSAVGY